MLLAEIARIVAHIHREQRVFGGTPSDRLAEYVRWEGESDASRYLSAYPEVLENVLSRIPR